MKIKTTKIRASFECPKCGEKCFFNQPTAPNCSTECSHCGAELLIQDNTVYPLHEKLHEEDPRWPADGKGTGHLTINDDEVTVHLNDSETPRQNPEGSP